MALSSLYSFSTVIVQVEKWKLFVVGKLPGPSWLSCWQCNVCCRARRAGGGEAVAALAEVTNNQLMICLSRTTTGSQGILQDITLKT